MINASSDTYWRRRHKSNVKQHTWWSRSGRSVVGGHVTQVNNHQRSCSSPWRHRRRRIRLVDVDFPLFNDDYRSLLVSYSETGAHFPMIFQVHVRKIRFELYRCNIRTLIRRERMVQLYGICNWCKYSWTVKMPTRRIQQIQWSFNSPSTWRRNSQKTSRSVRLTWCLPYPLISAWLLSSDYPQ